MECILKSCSYCLRQQPQNYHLTNRYVGQVFQQLDPALAAAVGSPQNAFKKVSRIYQSRRKLSYDTFPTYRQSESSNSSPTSCQSHQQQSLQPPQSPTSLPTSTSLATLPGFTPSLPLQQPPRRTSYAPHNVRRREKRLRVKIKGDITKDTRLSPRFSLLSLFSQGESLGTSYL